jgi:hypothetical protein
MAERGKAMSREERDQRSLKRLLTEIKKFHRSDYGGNHPIDVIRRRLVADGEAAQLVELSGSDLIQRVAELCFHEVERTVKGIAARQDPYIDDVARRVEAMDRLIYGQGRAVAHNSDQ